MIMEAKPKIYSQQARDTSELIVQLQSESKASEPGELMV